MRAALTAAPLAANSDREQWMRARLAHDERGGLTVTPLENQDSSLVTIFASADALVRRPAHAPAAVAGDPVQILILDRLA
jgi:molybdopterin molybdotransferase